MLSEDALRAGAVACFTNAQELCEEARLLLDHARPPRAVVLALIGIEEFAKAVVYTVAALLPEQRHRLPLKLGNHQLKHQICNLMEGAYIMCSEGWAAAADAADYDGGTTPISRVGDLFLVLTGWGLDSFIDGEGARQYYTQLRLDLEADHRRRQDLVSTGHWQASRPTLVEPDLKNAALYVDLDADGQVMTPTTQVQESEALSSIHCLGWFLDAYAALPTVAKDDQCWRDLARTIRNGLDDPEARSPTSTQ